MLTLLIVIWYDKKSSSLTNTAFVIMHFYSLNSTSKQSIVNDTIIRIKIKLISFMHHLVASHTTSTVLCLAKSCDWHVLPYHIIVATVIPCFYFVVVPFFLLAVKRLAASTRQFMLTYTTDNDDGSTVSTEMFTIFLWQLWLRLQFLSLVF